MFQLVCYLKHFSTDFFFFFRPDVGTICIHTVHVSMTMQIFQSQCTVKSQLTAYSVF